jgi:3'(2'), 5'-bisphosphate nucleotidase
MELINPALNHHSPVSSSKGTLSTPIMKEPSRWLKSVVKLAKEAGRRVLTIYQSDFRVGVKDDKSPLTAADLASHHCLVEGLSRLSSVYPILSEESKEVAYKERSAWETYWLIDPLDGTKEFIKRNGEFTVNIALVHQNRSVLGVVYAPVLDVCYFGAENCGAFKQTNGGAYEVINVRMPAPGKPIVVGSRSHGSADVSSYLAKLSSYELRSIGSSLKFCLVAEGQADLYPRLGLTSEWDTAAAQCVVEAAGGKVTDLAGKPLRYNTKESLLNPYFLAYGDGSRDWLSYAMDRVA